MQNNWIHLATGVLVSVTISCAAQAAPSAGQSFRLCVLDQAAVIQRSRLARDMGMRFQKIREQAQAKLEDERRTLDADARAIDGLRTSIPAAVAKSRDAEIAQRRVQLKAREEQTNRNLAALDGQLTANVAQLSEPIVRAIEVERGCSMSIDKGMLIHLQDASLDITPMVVNRMNANASANENHSPAANLKGR